MSRAGQPADFPIRVGQFLIDGLVLAIPYWIIIGVIFASTVSTTTFNANGTYTTSSGFGLARVIGAILFGALVFAYEYLTIRSMGATVGMKVLGLAVVRQEDGGPLPPDRLAIRSAFFAAPQVAGIVPALGVLVWLGIVVCFLAPLWEPTKQGYHDKFTKAMVVRTK